jgi:chitin synthase
MFAAIFISVDAIRRDVNDENGFSPQDLLKNPVFYNLIISVTATYGIWFIASLLMFDPWHMVTSLIQYVLLTPTYVNVLNVYAFCNTHDVSWGTKGDDKAEALPSVSTKDGTGKTDLPDETDLDAQYMKELAVFREKPKVEKKAPTPAQLEEKQMDYYRAIRSITVLGWMISNFALIAAVLSAAGLDHIVPGGTSDKDQRVNIYMSVVLWSVAGLSAFKFIGAMWFLVVRMFRGV